MQQPEDFARSDRSHSAINWSSLDGGASLGCSGLSHADGLAKQLMLTTHARKIVTLASYSGAVSANHVRGCGGHRPPGPLLPAPELQTCGLPRSSAGPDCAGLHPARPGR